MLIRNELEIENFRKLHEDSSILLIPEFSFDSINACIEISEIRLNNAQHTQDQINADYWTSDLEKYFLTKQSLDKIAKAAGIKFTDTSLCLREVGTDSRVIYCKQKIKYEYRMSETFIHSSVVSGEYSYFEDLSSIKYKKDYVVDGKVINTCGEVIKDLVEIRRLSSGSVAEANAKRKALIEIFPRLKKPFTLEQLKNPIYVGKIILDSEILLKENPEFKSAFIAKMLDLGKYMYMVTANNNSHLSNSTNTVHDISSKNKKAIKLEKVELVSQRVDERNCNLKG